MSCFKPMVVIVLALSSATAGAQAVAASVRPLQEFKCGTLATNKSGQLELQVLPALHILGMDRFSPPPDAPTGISSFFCVRSAIAFAANDYQVVMAGYPFIVYSADAERVGSLEIADGRLQLRMLSGKMTDKESSDGQRYLDENQTRFNAK